LTITRPLVEFRLKWLACLSDVVAIPEEYFHEVRETVLGDDALLVQRVCGRDPRFRIWRRVQVSADSHERALRAFGV